MRYFAVFVMFICCSIGIDAQTYAYKHIYSVNSYGEKIEGTGRIVYYTFSNEKRYCHRSDEFGKRKCEGIEHSASYRGNASQEYYYIETINNIHRYYGSEVRNYERYKNHPDPRRRILVQTMMDLYKESGVILRFSSDFSKLNIVPYSASSDMETLVYERASFYETESRSNSEFYD